ncbi:hypothetical protein GCM10009678_51270 [Actinomadura kijaniata]|uniref:Uncharacterized protein n=1 Tax=Actinomadura namibiensis TaxID=182080 RepID=A0A7W3LL28_ACTNM|nr:hypothetical protein [Actinomadura namibiensis]MBA8950094.1 hypothetical protein [Actinomadura namibiensis]
MAEIPEQVRRRSAKLILDEDGARVSLWEEEYPIPREDVAKVYVCKKSFFTYGLCFQMKDPRDYIFWFRGNRKKAEAALWLVRGARYPVSRKIYQATHGRLDRE